MTTKAFRAALFINSFNVPTPLEWLVLGCIGVFASFTLIHFSRYLSVHVGMIVVAFRKKKTDVRASNPGTQH